MVNTFSLQEKKIVGGSQQISEKMAESLGMSVKLSKQVTHIQQDGNGVIVTDRVLNHYKVGH